jgi:predicted acyltransferase
MMNETVRQPSPLQRLASIDVFRGMVMFLMLAEMLRLGRFADMRFTSSWGKWMTEHHVWDWLKFHTTHVEWSGGSLHDMIQPGFSFLVGVSLPFSLAARQARGQSRWSMLLHAAWRAMALVLLGIFLRSLGRSATYFTFEDTLSQIGLGYFFLVVLGMMPSKATWIALGTLLVGCWLAFFLFPLPGADFSYPAVGVPEDWQHHRPGIAAHWNKNSNLSWWFDRWFLNLFPREKPFEFHPGGYATLSFVPTLATMLLGAISGSWLKGIPEEKGRAARLLLLGGISMGLGWLLDLAGLCPIVKRIWTPSWTLWSGGICVLWLLALHWICDVAQWRWWAFPFSVIGANSILAYVIDWTILGWIRDNWTRHLQWLPQRWTTPLLTDFGLSCLTFATVWLVLLYLYRKRIFIRL